MYALNDLYKYILILVTVSSVLAGPAQGTTIDVIPGESLQAAIDEANPGDTILVERGVYRGGVNVTKSLHLEGIDMPVVDANGNGSAIVLSAPEITLEGFVLTNSSGWDEAGIKVVSKRTRIFRNRADYNDRGLYLSGTENNVSENKIVYNHVVGIAFNDANNNTISDNDVRNCGINGISLSSSHHNEIVGNEVSYNNAGIVITNSSHNLVSNNAAKNNINLGVFFSNSSHNIIKDNEAINNGVLGINIKSSSDNVISENTISYSGFVGLALEGSTQNRIFENDVQKNGFVGLRLKVSSQNQILDNDLSYSSIVCVLLEDSDQNIIENNNISESKNGINLKDETRSVKTTSSRTNTASLWTAPLKTRSITTT